MQLHKWQGNTAKMPVTATIHFVVDLRGNGRQYWVYGLSLNVIIPDSLNSHDPWHENEFYMFLKPDVRLGK